MREVVASGAEAVLARLAAADAELARLTSRLVAIETENPAAQAVRDAGVELAGRIGLVFVPDEETGGAGGAGYLAREGLLGAEGIGMLSAKPTGGLVWSACRGALSLRLTVHGRESHVGLAHEGVNAFERMLDVAARLRALERRVRRRRTRFAIEPEAARRSILLLGGECGSGASFNVVPGRCSFTVDRRLNPEENLEAERERLLAVVEALRAEGYELEVEVLQEAGAAAADESGELGRALAASIATVTGEEPRFELCPGLLELRFYARLGLPAFCYGPGRLDVSHGAEEFVEVAALRRCAQVYALTALRLLSAEARRQRGAAPRAPIS
jgi:succinyl-diaminopimelate desuccinylase